MQTARYCVSLKMLWFLIQFKQFDLVLLALCMGYDVIIGPLSDRELISQINIVHPNDMYCTDLYKAL